MPREVSDIKQFIEICRRKDARCKFSHLSRGSFAAKELSSLTVKPQNSGPHKEIPQRRPDQIQSPLLKVPLHSRSQRRGQGRQAEAELTTEYVSHAPPFPSYEIKASEEDQEERDATR